MSPPAASRPGMIDPAMARADVRRPTDTALLTAALVVAILTVLAGWLGLTTELHYLFWIAAAVFIVGVDVGLCACFLLARDPGPE